jgi:hypothetical protein
MFAHHNTDHGIMYYYNNIMLKHRGLASSFGRDLS